MTGRVKHVRTTNKAQQNHGEVEIAIEQAELRFYDVTGR